MKRLLVAACAAFGFGAMAFAGLPMSATPQTGLFHNLGAMSGTSTVAQDSGSQTSQGSSSDRGIVIIFR